MTQTTARIKRGGKHFEILVDLEEALKVRNESPGANINSAVLTNDIFYNLKSGEHASTEDLQEFFETTDAIQVAEKIIKSGEVVRTSESIKDEQEKKYKQVVDFLSRNAVSPSGIPYTPDRIMKSLSEAHVNIKNKSIESQISEIIDQLSKILPLKIEKKKFKITIPATQTGKAYGTVKEFMIKENWLSNGNLEAQIEVPSGIMIDFFEKLNNQTHGAVMSEELK